MRRITALFIIILISGVILFVSSCATAPTGPIAPGEVRLLKMDIPQEGTIKRNLRSFPVDVFFETVGEPEIQRACFYGLWKEPYRSNVIYTTFGAKKIF